MIYDYQNTIDFAEQKGFDKGLEEGLKEGLEKGREDATREIALRLYSLGMSREQVAQATGLSDDLLNEILSNR
jgi:predicted transposase/invertase (TIGR01784 family)